MGKRTCVCGVMITTGQRPGGGYQPQACRCVGSPPKGEITHYKVYPEDVYSLDERGIPRVDVNGNFIYLHRKGDYMLDLDGHPIIVSKEEHAGKTPHRDSILNRQTLPAPIPSAVTLAGLSSEQFEELAARVEAERQRRNCLAVARL